MGQRPRWPAIALIVLVGTSCGVAAPSATPDPPATYEEYAVEACAAWDALFRAVGNPDTGGGSALSRSLDEAVVAGDAAAAERLAGEITRELEVGRRHVAIAGGWPPRAAAMEQLDRVFRAFEAMTAAKRATAAGEPGAPDPQAAFEAAGGVEAWFAMLSAMQASGSGTAGADAPSCANVPVTP